MLRGLIGVAAFASGASETIAIDKAQVTDIFVKGRGIKVPGMLTQAQVDMIDRNLHVDFNLPPLSLNSDQCATKFTCPALSYAVTPGMTVSTAMTRNKDYPSDMETVIRPGFSWNAVDGVKYSIIMTDAFSEHPFWNMSGSTDALVNQLHMAAHNIMMNDLATGTIIKEYSDPGNFIASTPNIYAFMVFEHASDVDVTVATEAGKVFNGLQAYLTAVGLTKLVAMNYVRVVANAYSYVRADANGGQMSAMVGQLGCDENSVFRAKAVVPTCCSVDGTGDVCTGMAVEPQPTCGDIKAAYKESGCCGNPEHPFEMHSQMRRLSEPEDLEALINKAFAEAKENGGAVGVKALAEKIAAVTYKYGSEV